MQNQSQTVGIHPLSIEAISPTPRYDGGTFKKGGVSILCQSRLFLLPVASTYSHQANPKYPSSVNRGYFSYNLAVYCFQNCHTSIHPLSIEAISPTRFFGSNMQLSKLVSILCQSRLFLLRGATIPDYQQSTGYPSSVNRGYFSYRQFRQLSLR